MNEPPDWSPLCHNTQIGALFPWIYSVDPQGEKIKAIGFETFDLGSHIFVYVFG